MGGKDSKPQDAAGAPSPAATTPTPPPPAPKPAPPPPAPAPAPTPAAPEPPKKADPPKKAEPPKEAPKPKPAPATPAKPGPIGNPKDMRLTIPPNDPAALKCLIAAKAGNTAVYQVAGKSFEAEIEKGVNVGATGALRYIATKGAAAATLYPVATDPARAAQIDAWVEFSVSTLDPLAAVFAPGAASDAAARASAQARLAAPLSQLDAYLSAKKFLVGDAPTLADVAVVGSLANLMRHVVGGAARAKMPNLARHYVDCVTHASGAFAMLGGADAAPVMSSDASDAWTVPSADAAVFPAAGPVTESAEGAAPAAAAAAAAGGGGDAEKAAAKKAKKAAEAAAKKAKLEAKKAKLAELEAAKKAKEAAGGGKEDKKKKKGGDKGADEHDKAALEAARAVPAGEYKNPETVPMAKAYDPKGVEAAWYEWWEKEGFFKPEMGSKKPKFVIVIPPPNVTGALHIGHALTNSIQDTIVRWRRMGGYEALWVPGTDHAGIATQTVVEKKLQREEGITRHDLGREKFLERVFEWKDAYGGKIFNQLRRLGSSMDWSRERFTMDEMLSKAVKEAFVRMHKDGLIYRDNRLVNWCCRLKTAISDIEVDHVDLEGSKEMNVPGQDGPVEFGSIWSFAYKYADGEGEIVVATTRPETMLGDTAVAVHPDDPRYKAVQGKMLVHPFNGRKIPVICDAELVDMSFGTGAVKITPAHDPNDFMTGKRHNLEFINMLTEEGLVNDEGGEKFKGMKRFTARKAVIAALDELGLYRGKADNPMRLGLCSRSKDVIEPMLKPQWWVDCQQMAADACEAARTKDLEILPNFMEPTWFRWLENIRDWCISRQLWWGHRIPAYYVRFEGETETDAGMPGGSSENLDRWVIGREEDEARAEAEKKFPGKAFTLVQDEDVLDTWFSSGLFPFSVFGWPDNTADLAEFYPTSLLETGHDILFFWVARMVMMGMKLTGKVPFKQVYLHAMVRDAHGRKMSKSLGNVIDPLHVIEGISLADLNKTLEGGNLDEKEVKKAQAGQAADYPEGIPECGTDAMRFALVAYTAQGRDINLDVLRVVGYRHWCNKMFNAVRFAMMNLGEGYEPPAAALTGAEPNLDSASKWALSRLNHAAKTINEAMESYDFNAATTGVYAFWQYDLCDVFIELVKPVVQGEDESAKKVIRDTLWTCLEEGLRLLHPFMPFVTEELWQRLPRSAARKMAKSIMIAEYPTHVASRADDAVEADFAVAQDVVKAARSLRSAYNLPPKAKPDVFIVARGEKATKAAGRFADAVATLASAGSVAVLGPDDAVPAGCGVTVIDESVTLYLLLKGQVDPAAEIAKLTKRVAATEKQAAELEKKMAMEGYEEKVPENVRADNADKMEKLRAEVASTKAAIEDFKGLM